MALDTLLFPSGHYYHIGPDFELLTININQLFISQRKAADMMHRILLLAVSLLFCLSFALKDAAARSHAQQQKSWQCPRRSGTRIDESSIRTCPLPGQLGIVDEEGYSDAVSWSFSPRCIGDRVKNESGVPWIECLFSDSNFRNGHGISLVTSPTITSHLLGLGALEDRPHSAVAQEAAKGILSYEIVNVKGKGKGVVAKRLIRRGEIVMIDIPAILVGTGFLGQVRPHHRRRMVKQAINQLPERTRNKIYKLSSATGEYLIDGIFGQNSNSVLLGDGQIHIGMFTEAARINHSCRPNAYFRFSERMLAMEVVAYHNIEAGEEIEMSYVPITETREDRRKYLKENWGFDCTCELCRATDLEIGDSESRRRRMKELKESVLYARKEGFFQDAVNMAEEWLMFSEWERLPPLMPEYYDTLTELYLLNGDIFNATRYGRMALDGWAKFGSVDDEFLERSRIGLLNLSERSKTRRLYSSGGGPREKF
ncbi:hypothetical protein B0T26DRAFT_733950 [Lasiosphaeria miniovina]|uniref:SET domain-containing protein n=1 Tax=Lasiosphaeria miniovina TaxID=1954250 RepID=A0AA39ZQ10_9PEZI|nr:uncharacterized protein B0T26DRAFT_733950 [Lasiosphaeria miniovina]KAK0701575.1 hypothetical protein B0T26DRAFT_733950 [Lasiosphaeria miniovina]